MSYIRCLSNPEGLYIWGEKNNRVAITARSGNIQYMPTNIFESILKRWIKAFEKCGAMEPVKWKGACIEEVPVGTSITVIMERLARGEKVSQEEHDSSGFRYRLTYKNSVKFDMYLSTLYFLAYSNEWRKERPIFKKRRKRK